MSGLELVTAVMDIYKIIKENPRFISTKGSFKAELYSEFQKRHPSLNVLHEYASDLSDDILVNLKAGNPDSVSHFMKDFIIYCRKKDIQVKEEDVVQVVSDIVSEQSVFNEVNFRRFLIQEMQGIAVGVKETNAQLDEVQKSLQLLTEKANTIEQLAKTGFSSTSSNPVQIINTSAIISDGLNLFSRGQIEKAIEKIRFSNF